MIALPQHKQLVLFDGVCNLCNASVNFIIKHDKKNVFLFAPLQGEAGQKIINKFSIDTNQVDSIILYNPKTQSIHYKSTAALNIAAKLSFPLYTLAIFLIIPPFIRNWVYDFIAKNRYKWFGKKEVCMLPTEEFKKKFL